jgi:hypothetical protein
VGTLKAAFRFFDEGRIIELFSKGLGLKSQKSSGQKGFVEELSLMEQGAVVNKNKGGKRSMVWTIYVVGAVLAWGIYGPTLHKGQVLLGNPLKALLCVGVAYFLIGVLVPLAGLSSQGGVTGFNLGGSIWAGIGGAMGALGAVCIIYAFKAGGLPNYVMPLVFGGAPVINVIVSMATHPPKAAPNPLLYVGFALAVLGAAMVLYYKPS